MNECRKEEIMSDIKELKSDIRELKTNVWSLKTDINVNKTNIEGQEKIMKEIKEFMQHEFSKLNTLIIKTLVFFTTTLLTITGFLIYNYVIK